MTPFHTELCQALPHVQLEDDNHNNCYYTASLLSIIISIIAQVIIEMCTLWLVENDVISHYNHPARGDYTGALTFKMATLWFLDVFKEEKKIW